MVSTQAPTQIPLPNQPTLSCRRQAIVSPTTERCLTSREETLLRQSGESGESERRTAKPESAGAGQLARIVGYDASNPEHQDI